MNICRAIKVCRQIKRMNQTKLAVESGVSVAHICLIENGKRNPSLDIIEKLARALEIDILLLIYMGKSDAELSVIPDDIESVLSRHALNYLRK